MKKITTLLVSTLLATTAVKADQYTYFLIEGGYAKAANKDKIINYVTSSGTAGIPSGPSKLGFQSVKKPSSSGVFTVGAGYKFDDNLRSDITFSYFTDIKSKFPDPLATKLNTADAADAAVNALKTFLGTATTFDKANIFGTGTDYAVKISQQADVKIKTWSVMANGYFDFNSFGNTFVPYVSLGFGVAQNKYKTKDVSTIVEAGLLDNDGKFTPAATAASISSATGTSNKPSINNITDSFDVTVKNKTNLAYQVGLGALVKVSDAIDFKFGYKFSDHGRLKLNSLKYTTVLKDGAGKTVGTDGYTDDLTAATTPATNKEVDLTKTSTKLNLRIHQLTAGLQFKI